MNFKLESAADGYNASNGHGIRTSIVPLLQTKKKREELWIKSLANSVVSLLNVNCSLCSLMVKRMEKHKSPMLYDFVGKGKEYIDF